jgi:cobalt/nickel transport system permease protein
LLQRAKTIMHISDGVLSPTMLAASWALGGCGFATGLRSLEHRDVPRVATLASAFFVAALIHVPIGPVHAHLVLSGLMGLLLGWAAVPAIALALLLQATMFGFGGFTSLGANIVVMGAPAIVCHHVLGPIVRVHSDRIALMGAATAGAIGIIFGAALLATMLVASGSAFTAVATAIAAAHAPLVAVEAAITTAAIGFLRRARPELLQGRTAVYGAEASYV